MIHELSEEKRRKYKWLTLLAGVVGLLLLESVAWLSWRAWLFVLGWAWPHGPEWVFTTVHALGVLAVVLNVFGMWRQFSDHRYCGSNRWEYECALGALLPHTVVAAVQTFFVPLIVACAPFYLLFWSLPEYIKEERASRRLWKEIAEQHADIPAAP